LHAVGIHTLKGGTGADPAALFALFSLRRQRVGGGGGAYHQFRAEWMQRRIIFGAC